MYAEHACLLQDLCVGDFVLPLDSQDSSETGHVESFQTYLLSGVGGPALATIQEGAQYTGLIHFQCIKPNKQ